MICGTSAGAASAAASRPAMTPPLPLRRQPSGRSGPRQQRFAAVPIDVAIVLLYFYCLQIIIGLLNINNSNIHCHKLFVFTLSFTTLTEVFNSNVFHALCATPATMPDSAFRFTPFARSQLTR